MGADQPKPPLKPRTEVAFNELCVSSVFHELLLCLNETLSQVAPAAFRVYQKESCLVYLREDMLGEVVLDGRVVVGKVKDVVSCVVVELVHLWSC